jgi:pSer/pThr/pTyr-binding forkhead associated (FHA) protein
MMAALLGNRDLRGLKLPGARKGRLYKRYIVTDYRDICIGRGEHNAICYSNKAVSFLHARLSRNGTCWVLYDENSTNGTYVNHIRVWENCRLKPGDVIEIMALRIVVGNGFLAINHPEEEVRLEERFFTPFKRRSVFEKKPEQVKVSPRECFKPVKCSEIHFFTAEQCENLIATEAAGLWERSLDSEDFLKFRAGQEKDVLDLRKQRRIGVTGRDIYVSAFARELLLQMITCCPSDCLKIIFLWDEESEKTFSAAKWLPHAWDDEKKISFSVKDAEQLKKVVKHLHQEGKRHSPRHISQERKKNPPFFVVFAFNQQLTEHMELIPLLNSKENMSALFFSEKRGQLPKECGKVLDIAKTAVAVQKEQTTKMSDNYGEKDRDLLYLSLANLKPDTEKAGNKASYLVELYVPAVGEEFAVNIPADKRIGELLPGLEQEITRRTAGGFCSDKNAVLCDGEAGIVLNVDLTPEETGILNGTKLMLI